mmetsp:Transcript_59328/g.171937  ORF Transcript_59328/g.171937 Transcript_59328/m.171937 type:complete len:278 (-) Transcript_59328:1055-1888(-)
MRKWSRLRNCKHSFVTAHLCRSGWCFLPTKRGRSASDTGPMERSSSGTSNTLLPASSSTTSAQAFSFWHSGDSSTMPRALSGDCCGRGGRRSRVRLDGDMPAPVACGFIGVAQPLPGGRIGDGGMFSGIVGNHGLDLCGEEAALPAPRVFSGEVCDFSGETSVDEGAISDIAFVEAKDDARMMPGRSSCESLCSAFSADASSHRTFAGSRASLGVGLGSVGDLTAHLLSGAFGSGGLMPPWGSGVGSGNSLRAVADTTGGGALNTAAAAAAAAAVPF